MALFPSYNLVKIYKALFLNYNLPKKKKKKNSSTNLKFSNPETRLQDGKVLDTHLTQTKYGFLDF